MAAPFTGFLVAWAWLAIGLILLIALLWSARRRERRVFFGLLALATAGAGLGILAGESQLERFGDDLRFAAARSKYEAIVRRVEKGESAPGEKYLGIDYRVDPGPPQRVAFPLPGSVIDNWCAVIYDRSGSLKVPNSSVRGIFGGDLVGCRLIDGAFFQCCFT
jgi:hypothetical protein